MYINMTSVWSRVRLTPPAFGLLVLVLSVGALAFGARSSAAQTADTDADSYADDLEVQLGSSPTNPDSTPEHFALLWTCTDGNDNDKDGRRDFRRSGMSQYRARLTVYARSYPAAHTGPRWLGRRLKWRWFGRWRLLWLRGRLALRRRRLVG